MQQGGGRRKNNQQYFGGTEQTELQICDRHEQNGKNTKSQSSRPQPRGRTFQRALLLVNQCCTFIPTDDETSVVNCCKLMWNLINRQHVEVEGKTFSVALRWCLQALRTLDDVLDVMITIESLLRTSSQQHSRAVSGTAQLVMVVVYVPRAFSLCTKSSTRGARFGTSLKMGRAPRSSCWPCSAWRFAPAWRRVRKSGTISTSRTGIVVTIYFGRTCRTRGTPR